MDIQIIVCKTKNNLVAATPARGVSIGLQANVTDDDTAIPGKCIFPTTHKLMTCTTTSTQVVKRSQPKNIVMSN